MSEIKKFTKQNFKKPYYPPQERNNFKTLLNSKGDYSKLVITFMFPDGSKKKMDTNPEFFKDIKGRPLKLNEIIQNINSLKHDFQATSYSL